MLYSFFLLRVCVTFASAVFGEFASAALRFLGGQCLVYSIGDIQYGGRNNGYCYDELHHALAAMLFFAEYSV